LARYAAGFHIAVVIVGVGVPVARRGHGMFMRCIIGIDDPIPGGDIAGDGVVCRVFTVGATDVLRVTFDRKNTFAETTHERWI
jgi:hypothetical protein